MTTFPECLQNQCPYGYLYQSDRHIHDKYLIRNYSIYGIIQILSVSAFDKIPIRDLPPKSQVIKNVKEPQYNFFDIML